MSSAVQANKATIIKENATKEGDTGSPESASRDFDRPHYYPYRAFQNP